MVFVLALLLVLASPFKELKAQSVEEVLEKIQHFYSQTQTLRGSFSQETIFPNGNKENRSGKIWMKKPGLFRWEYNTPEKFIIISDSRNIYVYYPEENQAFVYPSGKALSSQLALGFMSGRGNLRKDLKLESFKVLDEGLWQLNFLPAYQDSQVEKVSLRVNLANGEVQELLLHYFSGERVRITFKSLEYNLDIPDRVFKFTPPKNVKIN
jgi:outer membrane lipoprotein carrier protein